ncbi:hypothetical protein [Microbacterium xylanilyticum]
MDSPQTDVRDVNLDELETLAHAATAGPWRWTDHRVPDLLGRAGDPGTYEYEREVIEAAHWGDCGCRSACTLELNIRPQDRAYIASVNPATVLALIGRVRELEARIA